MIFEKSSKFKTKIIKYDFPLTNNFINVRVLGKNGDNINDFWKVIEIQNQIFQMSVNSKGIDLWNVLPKSIKKSVSLEVFKKCVRKQLLDKY